MGAVKAAIDNCNRLGAEKASLWEVRLGTGKGELIGRILPQLAEQIVEDDSYVFVDKEARRIIFLSGAAPEETEAEAYNAHFIRLFKAHSGKPGFPDFQAWLKQRYTHPVYTTNQALDGLKMPSPLRGIIGIVTFGVHMTVYTKKIEDDGRENIYIWVATRSNNVTFPGMLDQIVAGAVSPEDNFTPQTSLIREAEEEASFDVHPDGSAYYNGDYVGTVTPGNVIKFFDRKDAASGSEDGHIEPGIRFTCDLEVRWDFEPTINETDSISSFDLKSVSEVCGDLEAARWKPNCGLVMADFLLRHGLVDSAGDQEELRASLIPELGLNEPEAKAAWWYEKI